MTQGWKYTRIYMCRLSCTLCINQLGLNVHTCTSKVKQTNKAKQHSTPKAVTFPKKNVSYLGWDSNPQHSTLYTELSVHAIYRSHTGGIQCTTYHYTADLLRLYLSYNTLVLRLGKQTDGGKLAHWRVGGNNDNIYNKEATLST